MAPDLSRLELDEDQRNAIEAEMQALKTEMSALRHEMQANREAMRALAREAEMDSAALEELARAEGVLAEQAALMRAETMAAVYGQLDEQQQAQMTAIQAEREALHEQRRHRVQQHRMGRRSSTVDEI